ncbi:hypothetical protein BBP40_007670 [Aspergillus hancockii]|nr:hypothetical protein BBP40_007670 [Aspergillus hancockii]
MFLYCFSPSRDAEEGWVWSHVMRGKNQKPRHFKGKQLIESKEDCNKDDETMWERSGALFKPPSSIIPKKLGSEVSFFQFADTVEPSLAADIMKYDTCPYHEDHESAKHHLKGLHKIVSLRGGMANFTDDMKLKTEIFRYHPFQPFR